jgi:hypothetical protein
MPLPPPRASTEGRDRRVEQDIVEILRILHAEGPQSEPHLARLVGADQWVPGRLAHALSVAAADGRVLRDDFGRVAIP